MIEKFRDFEKLFKEIDAALTKPVHFYVIGGAVMLYYNLKSATKDIDIVVDSLSEFQESEKLLKQLSFKTEKLSLEYKNFDLSQIFVRDDYRVDLFHQTVCKGFKLSYGMKERANKIIEFDKLTVSLCSTTDIFMFKTFTEREGDIDDCLSLAQKDIDWDAMLKEIEEQMALSGKPIWITYIGERLDLLVEKKLTIPIMKKVDKLRNQFYDNLEKQLNK